MHRSTGVLVGMNVKRQAVRNPEVPIPEIGFHMFLIFWLE
jgi:hypothetical protein